MKKQKAAPKLEVQPRPIFPKKIIVAIMIIALFALAYKFISIIRQPASTQNLPSPTPVLLSTPLPPGWSMATPSAGNTLKLVKETQDKVKPSIVLITSAYTSDLSESKYADTIIKGARSALPSLTFTINRSENVGSFYVRHLQGTYINARNQVRVKQRLYIQNKTVSTLTASYLPQNLDAEIDTIFDAIFTDKINL
ncbi:MAG: hypothetical protein WC686_00435 [Candidatus Shapirobacteria bacterium]|jgi:hypothetical protein